uniref:Protein kinase domain-containing protein n=1 Tax=Globodera rostochiensis TaxID=31243 RepID=A0A914HDE4_GLORO
MFGATHVSCLSLLVMFGGAHVRYQTMFRRAFPFLQCSAHHACSTKALSEQTGRHCMNEDPTWLYFLLIRLLASLLAKIPSLRSTAIVRTFAAQLHAQFGFSKTFRLYLNITMDTTLSKGMSIADLIVLKKLGAGSYGDVYLCASAAGMEFAVKVEKMGTNELDKEQTIYEQLAQRRPLNFCEYFGYGVSVVQFLSGASFQLKYLKITVVGPTLDKFLDNYSYSRKFSPGTSISVSIQILNGLQDLDDIGFVHGDLKFANVAIGLKNAQRRIFLLDFGHSQSTSMYSRKNDTTPWFYMLLHMYGGPLGQKTKEEALRSCPSEFSRIHELIEAQQPHQRPQYETIKEQLYGCLCRLRIQEFPYDWEEGATRWALLPSSSEK